MIKMLFKLPRKIAIGFSGGVDSVAAADFLCRNHDLTLIYVNHHDEASRKELPFVTRFATDRHLDLRIYDSPVEMKGRSREHCWSKERHRVFKSIDMPVVTGHHLNDVVETWLMSSIQGNPSLMGIRNDNIVRPFLISKKTDFIERAHRRNLSWIEDDTNLDSSYANRNYVRNELMPHILKLNPGIETVILKKMLSVDLSCVQDLKG